MHMCRVYLHQAIMGKSIQAIEKTHNYPSVPKSYSTSRNGIGGHKKEEKISKTTALTYFDSLKNYFCRNDSVRCRRIFKPQRVSKYIERLPTKFSYLFLYWC